MARKVDPEPLSFTGKLVRWLDEDVEFFRVCVCDIPPWVSWTGLDLGYRSTKTHCSDTMIVKTGNGEGTEPG